MRALPKTVILKIQNHRTKKPSAHTYTNIQTKDQACDGFQIDSNHGCLFYIPLLLHELLMSHSNNLSEINRTYDSALYRK